MSESSQSLFFAAVDEIVAYVATLPADADAAAKLAERFPIDGARLRELADAMKQGVDEGWLCDRGEGAVRFGRVRKAAGPGEVSVDAVSMTGAGPGHTHPNGEFDLCFAVDEGATFDGNPAGWTVYPPGSWHVPTVEGGRMDILYFLPGGAIRFEAQPGS